MRYWEFFEKGLANQRKNLTGFWSFTNTSLKTETRSNSL